MIIGLLKENKAGESRVALTPDVVRKFVKKGFEIWFEKGCGVDSDFSDQAFSDAGAYSKNRDEVFGAKIIVKIHAPNEEETQKLNKGQCLIGLLDPFRQDSFFKTLAQKGVDSFSLELVPRTSRAQSMDVLSSQANIAGYRAVIEAASHYGRFFPLMMTSAGSAKPAKVIVLGAGVAGLQAIATAKRLGAMVESYDIRPEVKEQIESLGAKFVELDVGEEGSGQGGYAKELSEDSKKKQQAALTERLKKYDIIISTASIPGKKAPRLITREAVEGMRAGSVIIDMAASSGGNCELCQPGQVIESSGVKIVGHTNYPGMMPSDSSNFYAHNLLSLIGLIAKRPEGSEGNGADVSLNLSIDLEDDIVEATCVTFQGEVRK